MEKERENRMNIEIANRLVHLRKSSHLSQEALAEKLGISRQAVSKWERAEASPDTDNLILLAKLYHVSLDELLKTEEDEEGEEMQNLEIPAFQMKDEEEKSTEEEPVGKEPTREESTREEPTREESTEKEPTREESTGKEPARDESTEEESTREESAEESGEYVNIGLKGVHVKDKDGSEVRIGWDGIHVNDKKREEDVHIDRKGVFINGEKQEGWKMTWLWSFPFAVVISIAYWFLGMMFHAWHPGWLLFLLIPIWYSFISAVRKGNATIFAYPVLVTLVFLCAGFWLDIWHPAWTLYLTIPVYYFLASRLSGE